MKILNGCRAVSPFSGHLVGLAACKLSVFPKSMFISYCEAYRGESKPWRTMEVDEVLRELGVNPSGLSSVEAVRRLKRYGPNEYGKMRRRTALQIFWNIPIIVKTRNGNSVAILRSLNDDAHIKTRIAQYEALQSGKGVEIAKTIVLGKIEGQNIILRKHSLKEISLGELESV